jgi:hypothetical protein
MSVTVTIVVDVDLSNLGALEGLRRFLKEVQA